MVDLQDFHKIIEEKMKFRKERIDKSINMQCPKAVPEPMKDISNRLNTA